MRIVEVISDTNIGGAGVLLCNRMKYRDQERFSYCVILPRGSALKERFEALGVDVWEVDVVGDRSFSLAAIPRYCEALHRLRPDLVHCHGSLSCRIAALLCRVPRRVYTRHCVYPLPSWQRCAPARWLVGGGQMLLSHRMIAVAEAARDNLLQMGVSPRRITVIVNGADPLRPCSEEERARLRRKLQIPSDATVVGICARLEACKNHRCFLEAAKLLLGSKRQYRFLIVGEGSLGAELRAWCREQGIETYVIFTGFARDVSPYFHVMDINVNCSVGTETSSLSLSEGMSLGIPAVVSDYGGNPYMVRHGENGLVYPRGRPDLLAEAIERLRQDRELYRRLSENARRRFAEELNARRMTKKTEQLYGELLRGSRDHSPNNNVAKRK